LELDLKGQITERFTRAIEQLGAVESTGKKRLEIRLGGIYSLEGIARDSKEYHWPSMEVLTAYIRANAPFTKGTSLGEGPPSDIQAILNVLKNRRRRYKSRFYEGKNYSQAGVPADESEEHRLHLARTNLCKAYLRGTHLEGASLRGANLEDALLSDAHLEEAWLQGACLRRATLTGTALKQTIFDDSELALRKVKSTDEVLSNALSTDEKFGPADLEGADLRGADLSQAIGLTQEQINKAHCDNDTVLPEGLCLEKPPHWSKKH
jgi:hypothetical protein